MKFPRSSLGRGLLDFILSVSFAVCIIGKNVEFRCVENIMQLHDATARHAIDRFYTHIHIHRE